ncbi:MAG: SLC13 family permease [Verrucomicrobiae bacterium]|nr:SLC13 family permease [Verrucomicrobiae bacterium]
MTLPIGLVILITIATFVIFATERMRTDVLALSVLSILGVLGLLTPSELLSCFSNPAPVTVASMFVLGAGLTRTGALEGVANKLLRVAEKGEFRLMLAMLPLVAVVSAFINNTAVVTFFLPVALLICSQKDIPPSRLLIPLSYAAMLGGTITLIGTAPNIVVSNIATRLHEEPIHMFEPALMGILIAIVGLGYLLLIGRKLLPSRETLATLIGKTGGTEYRTELVVLRNSPLLGQKLGDVRIKQLRSANILGVTRKHEPLDPPFDGIVLEDGDRLILSVAMASVRDVQGIHGLALAHEVELGLEEISVEETSLVETIVPINSPLLGKTLRDLDFVEKHGVRVLALHRQGMSLRERFLEIPMRFGDTLLLQGTDDAIGNLRDERSLLFLSPVKIPPVRRPKGRLALAIVAGVMIVAGVGAFHIGGLTFGPFPVAIVAIIGSLVLVLTKCIDMTEAYESINWNIIMLIAGMLGLGLAMEKTGGAEFIAHRLNDWFGGYGPHLAVAGIYLITMLMTEMVSNNAVAALMTPIAISSAHALGCSARPFMFAVMFACSASFATPIGYQTNTMIYGAGGYKFLDFFKIGAPLNLLMWILVSLMVPILWPFK